MTHVTRTEYKTVEVDEPAIECDNCRGHFDEDEIVTTLQYPGDCDPPRFLDRRVEPVTRHHCHECVELPHAYVIPTDEITWPMVKPVHDHVHRLDSFLSTAGAISCIAAIVALALTIVVGLPWLYTGTIILVAFTLAYAIGLTDTVKDGVWELAFDDERQG